MLNSSPSRRRTRALNPAGPNPLGTTARLLVQRSLVPLSLLLSPAAVLADDAAQPGSAQPKSAQPLSSQPLSSQPLRGLSVLAANASPPVSGDPAAGRPAPSTTAPVAAAPIGSGWVAGAVLDLGMSSRALALGSRDKGLALGHSDLVARGPFGRYLQAQVTAVAHSHDDRFEMELEEAWFETRTLPAGLQIRAGRFASQIGYLNEQHPHTDDFVERPLLYRAFLGDHWIDEGLRFNWTAPTATYLRLGAELLRGRQLMPDGSSSAPGALALNARTGGDIGLSQSWQVGLSWLRNRRANHAGAADADADHDHDEAGHSHSDGGGHDHSDHAARYTGQELWLLDMTWKWAPEGNNRNQQLRVSAELARVLKPTVFASSSDRHDAASLAVVWRFRPDWEVGGRTDWLRLAIPHGDHFHRGRLREHALMLAWKPSHQQTLRLQYTTQRDGQEIEGLARRAVQLQYILSFGAHGAHSF